jgi:hypothetical protein
LGLFFAIDKTDAGNDLWDQFEAQQSAPMLLGLQTKFEDQVAIREPQPLVR